MQLDHPRKLQYEKIALPGPSSIAVRDIWMPYLPFTWHYHAEFELCLVVKGKGNRLVGDALNPYHADDLVFVGSNVPHAWHSKAEDGECHARVIQFNPVLWGDEFLSLPEVSRLQRLLFDNANRAFRVRGRKAAGIIAEIHRLFEQPFGSLQRIVTLLLMLERMTEPRVLEPICSACTGVDLPVHLHTMLRQALSRIHESETHQISHSAIAKAVGASPSTLSRLFRRGIGRTFVEYINDVRINRACRALIETDRNVSEIAFASGFENLSNFNRRFLLLKGMTPKEYRRIGLT